MTKTRLITALLLLPVVAFFVQLGGYIFLIGTLFIAVTATWEFVRMMQQRGHSPSLPIALLIMAVGVMSLPLQTNGYLVPAMAAIFMLSLVWQLYQKQSEAPVVDWALTLAGAGYIGVGLGHLLGLRQLSDGTAWVWMALVATWGADTFAYFVGRAFGKHKFFPRISPKKTWEGVFGGILGGIVGGVLVSIFSVIPLPQGIIIGIIVALFDPFGDLSISMMKRYAGVKDSSNLFPGHGGMLDRTDSVFFAVVLVYYYALWLVPQTW